LVDLEGLYGLELSSNTAIKLHLQDANKILGAYCGPWVLLVKSLGPNVSIREIIPSRRKGLAYEYLECDVRYKEMGVAHHIDAFTALLHLVEVSNYIVAFLCRETIEVLQVNDESLVTLIVMHALEALPHFVGISALTDMNHLCLCTDRKVLTK
jgi:hypothetical protein